MKKIVLLLVVILLFATSYANGRYEIMTENYPPFNYVRDGEARGVVSYVVKEIQNIIGWENEIKLYSWNRAYEMIKSEPEKILFSMARTDVREPLFKWVGPVILAKGYYFKNRESGKSPENVEDIKNNFTVGVRENSNIHSNFLKEGYKHIIPLENTEAYYRGLYFGRVDLIIASPYNIPLRAKKYELDASKFEQTKVQAGEGKLSIAFSKDTPDEIIALWENALNDIKNEGLLADIIKRGLKDAEADFGIKFNLNEF